MNSFKIETYKVRLEIERVGNPPVETVRSRIIEIVSPALIHGIFDRAVLNFSSHWDNWQQPNVVGYYETSNAFRPVANCWLPSAEYSLWYDVLRAETPLWFFYEIKVIGGGNYVGKIALGTTTEPVGEGPKDLSP